MYISSVSLSHVLQLQATFNHTELLTHTFNASRLIVPLSELAYCHHTGDCTNTIQPVFAPACSPQVWV